MIAICTPSSTITTIDRRKFCIMMKMIAVAAWPPRNIGATKASPMKPPSGSTSSLIMVGSSACLTLRKCIGREAQDAVVQLVAQAAQHALAHAALLGVDALLELAVHHDCGQEHEAHDDQVLELVDLEAVEDADDLAGEDRREVELPHQERDGVMVLEGVAGDAVVDDRLRHRQRHEVENLREHHEHQDQELLGPAESPDVGEQISLHQNPGPLRPPSSYIRSGP